MVCGCADGSVQRWDAGADAKRLWRVEGHASVVGSVAVSRDGKRMASASADGAVRVWAAADGARLESFERWTGIYRSVAFDAEGRAVANGVAGGRVWCRLLETQRVSCTVSLGEGLGAGAVVRLEPNGTATVAGRCGDHKLELWIAMLKELRDP